MHDLNRESISNLGIFGIPNRDTENREYRPDATGCNSRITHNDPTPDLLKDCNIRITHTNPTPDHFMERVLLGFDSPIRRNVPALNCPIKIQSMS